MTTEIESHGYEDLRSYVLNNWNFIAVVDDVGNEVLRWQVPDNNNTQILSSSGTNPATVELVVTGQDIQDAGNTLPVTVAQTEAFSSQAATTRFGYDTFSNITVQVPNDEIIILHDYSLPQ